MSSYGVEMRNADGVLTISSERVFARIVNTFFVTFNQSTTFSEPKFDDTRGTIIINPHAIKFDANNVRTTNDAPQNTLAFFRSSTIQLPTINWNNTTKILTVTPAIDYGSEIPDFKITMLHYK